MSNWTKAKLKASEIRKKYSSDDGIINAFKVAKGEGITILYFEPNEKTRDISGLMDTTKKVIYLNPNHSASKQNGTIAHELGHYFLQHWTPEKYHKNKDTYLDVKPGIEQEADVFAEELLMPKSLISKLKSKYGLTNDDYIDLAKLLGVAPLTMKNRLRSL
ncbi:MAG TPA: ImmA/IrrE family metallo-endopeptidase [Candidatus Saccharimonadales bacterium]|nr:ImmA/IrrE family metallo-endopeptidase [Candidatus Saccharimonadales bacterium]